MLFSGLQGAMVVGGVSALAGALTSIGVPKDSVLRYETALKANKFILMIHGDNQEISRAQEVRKSSARPPHQSGSRSSRHSERKFRLVGVRA
jgi:hypothetical protein